MKYILGLIFLISLNIFGLTPEGNKYVQIKNYLFFKPEINPNSFSIISEITPNNDWHTYWLNAGDAGLATSFDYSLPADIKLAETLWEYPHRIKFEEFANFGYSQKHYIINKFESSKEINLENLKFEGKIYFLVCKEKCIPVELSINYKLSKMEQIDSKKLEDIMLNVPVKDHKFKISAKSNEKNLVLTINKSFNMNSNLEKLFFFPIEEGIFQNFSDGNCKIDGNNYILEIPYDINASIKPEILKAVLVGDKSIFKSIPKKSIYLEIPIEK